MHTVNQDSEAGKPLRNLEVLTGKTIELSEQWLGFSSQQILDTKSVGLQETAGRLSPRRRQTLDERLLETFTHHFAFWV
jgi:hypothetical protein